jgi:hypothetical protein
VWKPASSVPLLAMRLAEALVEAGLPDGVLSLVVGEGAIGGRLVEHPGISRVTFTGSTGVGRRIIERCGALARPVQTEMGGKNAAAVLSDADLELAVDQVVAGAFRSTGQKCTATSRVIVAEAVADEFVARLVARASALTVGDPTDASVQMGPLVSGAARDSLQAALDYADARIQFDKPISAFQLTQKKLADMAVSLNSSMLLALHLGRLKDDHRLRPEQVSVGKLNNVREAIAIARECRTILGGSGISLEYSPLRHANNLESVRTYEGTDEVHTLVIGQALTGQAAYR